jgi:DNA repair/transcription protein MET18/MMS19
LIVLSELAKSKPQLILDITFPSFLAELPDSDVIEKRDASIRQRKSYKSILSALAQISCQREIFQVLLRRLFSKLDIVLSNSTSIDYPHAILGTIFLVVTKKFQIQDPDLPSLIETLIPVLLSKVILPATIPGPRTGILCSREIVHVVGLIVNVVLRDVDSFGQNPFYDDLFKLFVTGERSSLLSTSQDEISEKFRPFSPDAPSEQAEMIQIFVSALAAARKEVHLPGRDINHLLLQAADIIVSSKDDPRRGPLLKMIACVLNKQQNETQLIGFVDSVVHDYWIQKHKYDQKRESLEMISWVSFLGM